MKTPNPHVVELMRQDIRRVRRQTWRGLPDRICDRTTERKLKDAHEWSSFEQAERCRETYLERARQRLKRYLETGEIASVQKEGVHHDSGSRS